ncbi:MAG: recombination protein O N-terminal domain-containing protein, partial [Clostridia bacterium]|nr:recombination protein O N-terminal domain-containing protein [Clostridia bacterium]
MNVGESDRLVTLFTRENGIIRAFASGAKNIKSKKG